jgi:hypothetical protein
VTDGGLPAVIDEYFVIQSELSWFKEVTPETSSLSRGGTVSYETEGAGWIGLSCILGMHGFE